MEFVFSLDFVFSFEIFFAANIMKQCPVCKTNYSDKTLKFCLADGNMLSEIGENEQPTLVSPNRNPVQVNIPPQTSTDIFVPVTNAVQTQKRSVVPYVLSALVALLLIAVAALAVLVVMNPFGKSDGVISNNSNTVKPTVTPSPLPDNQNNELRAKLANLEKQLQEQKNKKPLNTQPSPSPAQNNQGTATARVRSSSDGFLSLRTEPSVKTGTQLIKIPTGATVQLENCAKNFLTIDGRRGRWCMVSYNGETGWAFDAWLEY